MSNWKVGDIVIERRQEWRQPVEYTARRISKVGRKYFYLDFGYQGWRNNTQYLIEDGLENNQYSSYSRVFKNLDALRNYLVPEVTIPQLQKKGLQFTHDFNAYRNVEVLLKLCEVMGCAEVVLKELDEALDKVRVKMLELEQEEINKVSL